MAKYIMEESNLPRKNGEKKLFPRLVDTRTISHERLVDYISKSSGLQKGAVLGVLGVLAERMSTWMGEGYSVKIDGLGRFTPSLGLRDGVEREESDEAGTHRNATSIVVNNVHFQPESSFLKDIEDWMDLERSQYHATLRPNQCPYSAEERLQRLVEYLHKYSYINVSTYMSLVQMKKTRAAAELREWAHDVSSPITCDGRVPHRVYMLKSV